MTSPPSEQRADLSWFLIHELRHLPEFLVRSRLRSWSDLEHLKVCRFRQGCYIWARTKQVSDLLPVEPLIGCERLDYPVGIEADGEPLQSFILRLRPVPQISSQRSRRGDGECLLDVSGVRPADIGSVLDEVDAAGLVRLSTWVEEDGRQWIHANASLGRRMPAWISGVECVLHRDIRGGVFVPPGTAHSFPARSVIKFLPTCEAEEDLVWDDHVQPGELRVVRGKRCDLSQRIDWPDLSRAEVSRGSRPDSLVPVGLRLESDRRSLEARRGERCHAVMHIRAEHGQMGGGKPPPAGLLDVLDDGDAGVRGLVYYCLPGESEYSFSDHFFRTVQPVKPLEMHQSALSSVYVQPKRFGDFDVPVFVRLGYRIWPEVNWLLDGASNLPKFVRELMDSLSLKQGDGSIALLDAGQSPEAPRVTILRGGRPLLESIDLLLKQWQPRLVFERLPSRPVVEQYADDSASKELNEAAQLLSSQFDAAVLALLGELDDVLGRVDESDRKTRAAASRAESLHRKAIEVFAPLGESWAKLIARLLELNKELQQDRYDWLAGVESLRAKLSVHFEQHGKKQEEAGELVSRLRDEIDERKDLLESRDRSIKGHISHTLKIEREIESSIGPKHRESLRMLGQRVDDIRERVEQTLRVVESKRAQIDQRVLVLQEIHRQLWSERALVDGQLRRENELKDRAESERNDLAELRRLAVALNKQTEQLEAKLPKIRLEVESYERLARKNRAEADRLDAEAIAAKEAAQAESDALALRREQSLKEMIQAKHAFSKLAQSLRDEMASADQFRDVVDRGRAILRELEAAGVAPRRRGVFWRLRRLFVR